MARRPLPTGMRRFGLRVGMAVVGVALVFTYATAAALGYLGLRFLWAVRPDPLALAALLLGGTALSGYLSHRFGAAQLLRSLRTDRVTPDRAPGLYRRIDSALGACISAT